jgi:hypothetical protein
MFDRHSLAMAVSVLALAFACPALAEPAPATMPLKQNGGLWTAGHVQGVAVDVKGGFIYYSFTNLLAKYDFSGKLIGTLVGWTGHLGDLDFNAADGKVYGSLEYKEDKAFYIAVIDVARLDRVGVEASKTEIFRTVYLPEVVKDYGADLNGDGVFEGDDGKFRGDVVASPDHRYDCSGIDGVSFGPAFGHTDGKRYLTVAYGVYGNLSRTDNDHQVLLQYDITDWGRYASPLTETAPHHNGRRLQTASTSCAPAIRATARRTWPMTRPSSAGSWASTRAASRPSPTICCSLSRRAPSRRWATSSACRVGTARAGSEGC